VELAVVVLVVVDVVVTVAVLADWVTVLVDAVALTVEVRTVMVGVLEAVLVVTCPDGLPGACLVTVFVPVPAATLMMKATAAPATNAAKPISQAADRRSCRLWPHSGQKEAPGATGAPQRGQTRWAGGGRSHSS
jgi:hypothetical protein